MRLFISVSIIRIMKRIACYAAIAGVSLSLLFACNKKGVGESSQKPWLRVITSEKSDSRPVFVLLEYPNSFRLDSLTATGDTLWSAAYPDSVGVFTLISAQGTKLWSFRMDPEKSMVFYRDRKGTRLQGSDTVNYKLAEYYLQETRFAKKFKAVKDSIARKKLPTDSILPIWKRKYARQDSLWQVQITDFARLNKSESVSIIPASSYLLITQNNAIRRPIYDLLDPSLRENALVAVFKSGY